MWYDDDVMVVDEMVKIYLCNVLSKFKFLLGEFWWEVDKKCREVENV